MRKIAMVLVLCVVAMVGCASADGVNLSEEDQGICSDSCGGLIGEVWQACIDVSCGGGNGPGPGGIDSGGGGGGGLGFGDACSGQDSCRNGCFCKDGFWRVGTNRAPGFCTYTTAAGGACYIAAAPLPPPPSGGGGGGGSTNPPCHGSGCTVENGAPPTSSL